MTATPADPLVDGRRPEASAKLRGRLDRVLLDRIREPLVTDRPIHATVSFEVEPGEGWTLGIDGSRVSLSHGLVAEADTTIHTDLATLIDVLDGTRSGIQAFIDGRIQARGNLALSLRLSGGFRPGERPARF